MEYSTTIQKFLDYLRFEKRFSEHTAKCYGADLRQFGEFLTSDSGDTHHEGQASSTPDQHGGTATAVATQTNIQVDRLLLSTEVNTVRAYLAFLNDKQYSKATIARKLATLRSFYKFLVKRSEISDNPVIAVRTPKQEKKLPRYLEYEEVKRLLETPPMDTWRAARDSANLETL